MRYRNDANTMVTYLWQLTKDNKIKWLLKVNSIKAQIAETTYGSHTFVMKSISVGNKRFCSLIDNSVEEFIRHDNFNELFTCILKQVQASAQKKKLEASKLPQRNVQIFDDVEVIPNQNASVTSNMFYCNSKNHNVEDIMGVLEVLDKNCCVKKIGVPIFYCKNCNKYYLFRTDFYWGRKQGILLCKLIKEERKLSVGNLDLRSESELKWFGYTVDKEHDYSAEYRQALLQRLIDIKALSKYQIISLLDFFIAFHETNLIFEDACQKWQEDRNFIAFGNLNKKKYTMKIGSITYREYYR